MFRYATTIFLSAFLLFQVQPLIGKFVLPWFGGSPGVWTACMLFFQMVLLGGYAYAHFISSRLSGDVQRAVHLSLLAVSLCFLPIAPNAEVWKPSGSVIPTERILLLLLATIGLPYFLLSSTAPLLQESYRRETDQPPYRLYALSNAGSLLALLTYPFVFEPQLKLHTQVITWSVGYVIFVLLCGVCAWRLASVPAATAKFDKQALKALRQAARPAATQIGLWLALAACGSVMLLATTNQVTQEIPPVPFLWVLPLALYLLTFIICFDHERWYHRGVFLVLLAAAVGLGFYALRYGQELPTWQQFTIYSATMFVCCMVCHGELACSRPAPQFATLFYFVVSIGGAVGGILVAIVAPWLLNGFWEYPLALAATVLLGGIGLLRTSGTRGPPPYWQWFAAGAAAVALFAGSAAWLSNPVTHAGTLVEQTRTFYGALRLSDVDDEHDLLGRKRVLTNGRVEHGVQYLDPVKRRWATTYYMPDSGVSVALDHHPRRAAADPSQRNLRIGVVGLGAGTLAAKARAGDYLRFYEINPDVIRISKEFFTFRDDSPATIEIVQGDARIEMERELDAKKPGKFDVLVIDAFTSDSIPMHLLTLECVQLYLKHLKPDGILCIHVTNMFLDLFQVVRGISQELRLSGVMIDAMANTSSGGYYSSWALFSANQAFFDNPLVVAAVQKSRTHNDTPVVWTDDYASLWQVLLAFRRPAALLPGNPAATMP